MKRYRITVAYDGTDYHGWQVQPRDVTIAQTLAKRFERVFDHPVSILGASRTDAGVHALGQVARVRTELDINPERLLRAWNKSLPKDILIRSLDIPPETFHPCAHVNEKTYWYTLFTKNPLPFVARYGWHYQFIDQIDWNKFEKSLQYFLGTHDFASFCKQEGDKSTIRTINQISLHRLDRWNAIQVRIKGPSFVRFQIRRMIGYALSIAHQPHLPVDYIKYLLDNPDSEQTLIKADGSGLCLRKVVYRET